MADQENSIARLRPYNLTAGCLHLVQAVLIVVLANSFSLPVRATYMTGPPGPGVGQQQVVLFNLSFAGAIAAFFLLSAAAHFFVIGPGWSAYRTSLLKERNPFRWIEYSMSSSIMIVLIAMLVGISDIAALVALVGVNASMIGFGWMQERYERPGSGLGPFWIGCVAGIFPWIAPRGESAPAGLRLRHLLLDLHLLQLLRSQPVAPVQKDRQMGRLSLRRAGLRDTVAHRQECARLADLCLDAGVKHRALT